MPAAAVAEDIHRIESEATPPEPLRDSKPRPGHAYKRPRSRRLGALECTLLVLIALGIAITVVMAIINPSP